jgi:hypothetical protein
MGRGSFAIDCEAEGGGDSIGFLSEDNRNRIISCYAHDLAYGVKSESYSVSILNSVLEDCTYGIYVSGAGVEYNTAINCTIDGCGTGIYNNSVAGSLYMNNIISNSTGTGANIVSEEAYFDYNHWYNNSTDISGSQKGDNATSGDPKYNDAANDDFSLQSDSPCIDAGFSTRLADG